MEEPCGEGTENGGFLKLKQNSEWLLGDSNSVPLNKKMVYKEVLDDGERRKRLNFLRYEALKRELLLLTVGIGTACTGYCLVALSVQAAASYAVGVVFSCLYFQLPCNFTQTVYFAIPLLDIYSLEVHAQNHKWPNDYRHTSLPVMEY